MLEVNQFSNEELIALHRYDVEFALDILWEQNNGLTMEWIRRNSSLSKYKYEDLLSLSHEAFCESVLAFDKKKKKKFNTLYGVSLENIIMRQYRTDNYQKRSLMKEVSVETKVLNNEDMIIMDILGNEDDLTAINGDEELYRKAVAFAQKKVKKQYRKHFKKMAYDQKFGDLTAITRSIKKETGSTVSREYIRREFNKFKEYISYYILYNETGRNMKGKRSVY